MVMFFNLKRIWNFLFIILFLFLLGNFLYQNYKIRYENSVVNPSQTVVESHENIQEKDSSHHQYRNEINNGEKFNNPAKEVKILEHSEENEKNLELESISKLKMKNLEKRKKEFKEKKVQVPKVVLPKPELNVIKYQIKDRNIDFMNQIFHQKSIAVLKSITPQPKIDLCGVENIEDIKVYQYSLEKKIQQTLESIYKQMRPYKIPNFDTAEFKFHSQNGEDGILLLIFSLIGTTNKKSVEIAGGTGDENNSANLIINYGWKGLLVDGDEHNIDHCKKFFSTLKESKIIASEPHCIQKFVDTSNTPEMIKEYGFAGDLDLLSIDIDGVDLWILKSVLTITNPRVIVVEIQEIWGPDKSKSRPYSPEFRAQGIPSMGASLEAFRRTLTNYRMVGCISLGFNAFFIRKDVSPEIFPEVPNETCFRHWKNPQWKSIMNMRLMQGKAFEWVEIQKND